jgi:hypothetical protein
MIQIVKYKCCQRTFAACAEPECYTDKDWLKNLKEYVNRGDTVEMVESGLGLRLEKCQCQEPVSIQTSSQLEINF